MTAPDDPMTDDEFETLWEIFEGRTEEVPASYKFRLLAVGYIEDGPNGLCITEVGRRRLAGFKPWEGETVKRHT